MKPLDCKGEVNKCKIDIVDKGKDKVLRKLLDKIGKKRQEAGRIKISNRNRAYTVLKETQTG